MEYAPTGLAASQSSQRPRPTADQHRSWIFPRDPNFQSKAERVHLPVHASWLNQVEIYFSVIQRKVLTPNDFTSLQEVSQRLLGFQNLYEQAAKPFEWKFTRTDLQDLMNRLIHKPQLALAA